METDLALHSCGEFANAAKTEAQIHTDGTRVTTASDIYPYYIAYIPLPISLFPENVVTCHLKDPDANNLGPCAYGTGYVPQPSPSTDVRLHTEWNGNHI